MAGFQLHHPEKCDRKKLVCLSYISSEFNVFMISQGFASSPSAETLLCSNGFMENKRT
ncbi:hypothetical protein K435DRAFT_6072 [Dendrothele bispora CBS 962.96]|uniref:Uncharacterized protein n=1 Tax=Dendrothele bispora (strain CBS 962.96) TaxID=1314807 RepID=A0A4S8N0A7_DENBC|nr:hypothetical protein K435DRAFT_6072 [Dendrothele bispora CBS 962.96]